MFYERVFRTLGGEKVRFLVCGGIALNLHGVPRMTADLDLLVAMDTETLGRFIDAVKRLGLVPRVPVSLVDLKDPEKRRLWAEEKGMKVLSLWNPAAPLEEIDVFVDPPIDFEEAWRDRTDFHLGDLVVPTVSRRWLCEMKRLSGRRCDLADIEALAMLPEEEDG